MSFDPVVGAGALPSQRRWLIIGALLLLSCTQSMPLSDPSYVELVRSGGQVPTYRPTARIDVDSLSEADRRTLEALARDARLDQQPAQLPKSAVPDVFSYRLTVKLPGQPERTVTFHDQDGHPTTFDKLADWIRSHKGQ